MLVNLSFYWDTNSPKLISTIQTVKLVCIYLEITLTKNHKKQTFRDQVTGQSFSTVINEKSRFNGYFNSDFDDFLQLHSLTLYEYNEYFKLNNFSILDHVQWCVSKPN